MPKIGELPGSWRAKHDRIPPLLAKPLYEKVQELAKVDSSPVSVSRQLSNSFSLSLSPGTIRHWMVGDRSPGVGASKVRNVFKLEPSPALSYIIGANKGDGCTMTKSGMVKLEVTDWDFARTFNANMTTLFSRAKPNKILVRRRSDRLPMYIVKYSSRQLVQLLRQPLKILIELASAFPCEFLRGFFDSEGHVDVSITKYLKLRVGAENTNKKLLSQVRQLLSSQGIASKTYRRRKKGTIMMIRGKTFLKRRTSYSVEIGRLSDVKSFAYEIGFSIKRKHQKLRDAFSVIATHVPRARPAVWKRLYSKKGGEWVRQEPSQLGVKEY